MKENIATFSIKGKENIQHDDVKNVEGIREDDLTQNEFERLFKWKYLQKGTMMTELRSFMS